MAKLTKIVVIDSGGVEHIFNESAGDIENDIEFRPFKNGNYIQNSLEVTTRSFSGGVFDTEVETLFIMPRRIDVIFGAFDA